MILEVINLSKLDNNPKAISDIYIIIPAYCPDFRLLNLLKELNDYIVVVVNDGSGNDYKYVFQELCKIENCIVLEHAVNLGKGRAIKTGLNYILNNYENVKGVVTADADGQHLSCDIIKVAETLGKTPDKLILGCRNFQKNIPLRSKFGNIITKGIFKLMVGIGVSDTQTGLRGIPGKFIPKCIKLAGERYEYEINMLVSAAKDEIGIIEVIINTVYINDNDSSHFNPIFDSFRIYFVLFRFLISSVTTSGIDFFVFYFCTRINIELAISTGIARIIAGNYNFFINKKYVFKKKTTFLIAFIKYWSLVFFLGTLSYVGITFFKNNNIFGVLLSKVIVESLLFLFSFTVQRDFVFNNKKDMEE